MNTFEVLRHRLLTKAGLVEIPPSKYNYADLIKSEWSPTFEQLMRNRLIMGALRYGRIHEAGKSQYNRIDSMTRRLKKYEQSGNKEFLVDVANLCLLEFEECHHPNAHFHSADNTTEHVSKK